MMKSSLLILVLTLFLPIDGALGETRGIRNHNPANLVLTNIKWQGEVKCSDTRFECFTTPYYGIRAMYKTLKTYYFKYNRTTLHDIMHHWSPTHENRTNHLIDILSNKLQYDPDTPIPINDVSFMSKLGVAMITIENGSNPYSSQLYRRAIEDAFRNNYTARKYADRRITATLVNELKVQGRATEGFNRKNNNKKQSSIRSTEGRKQTTCIYKTNYSFINYLRSYCFSFDSSTILWTGGDSWLDRMAKRLLILHGRKGCSRVENCYRVSDYSPPYSPSLSDKWVIFREFYDGKSLNT